MANTAAGKKLPVRQCLGCREHRPKREMLRIVRTPEGEVHVDFSGKANGRGTYLCRNSECLRRAVKARALEHTLQVPIPEKVLNRLQLEMEQTNED